MDITNFNFTRVKEMLGERDLIIEMQKEEIARLQGIVAELTESVDDIEEELAEVFKELSVEVQC